MGTFRMARINKQLQREISLLLEQRIKNETAARAVITGVDCSRDLELARVYFTTLDPRMRESVLEELRNVKGALRTMLGQVLKLRHIPALEFEIDRAPDYGHRIDDILDGLGFDAAKTAARGEEKEDEDEDEDRQEQDEEEDTDA